ncbi:MAG: hypothetical protein GWP60_00345 [Gammaproteobacteria bacterium]|jgi:hypothetical protein|nr:hypothetical protein [Gammaproteobacteria bacterium]
MDDYRTIESGYGGQSEFADADGTSVPDEVPVANSAHARDGDVFQGLRSGLIFSLAIWAMLFTVGALFFA